MIGADIAAELPLLRAEAESMMVDACRIIRPGARVFDPDTGRYVETSTVVYEGRCRVRPQDVQPRDVGVGEAVWTVQTVILSLPVASSAAVRDEDRVTVTAAAHDPALVGRELVAKSSPARTYATARRFICEWVAP